MSLRFPHQIRLEMRLRLCWHNKIRHLPIITDDRSVVGIITDRDLKEIVPSTMSDTIDINVYEIRYPR